jgi:glycosyltransferase involved in cell wall biosynthesis
VKILFITARTDLGGGPKHVLDLLKSLKGVDAFLAAPLDEPFGHQILKYCKDHLEIRKRSFTIIDFIKIFLFLKRNQIRIIHSHGRGAGLYSRMFKLFGFKIIHTFHGVHEEKGLIGRMKFLTDLSLANFSDHYICVSDEEKVKAAKVKFLGNVPCTVIYNGIDLEDFPYKYVLREVKVLGCMARASYQKGYEILFSHLIELKKVWPDFIFKIAGPKLSELEIPNELKNNCVILGPMAPQKFLEQIDLYVSSSRWEGMPLAILEAMAFGVPCLLSRVIGHEYFILKKGICMSFVPLNFEQFNDEITKIRSNLELRKSISHAARNNISEVHSSNEVAIKTKRIYDQC